jgi:hypothetical protein
MTQRELRLLKKLVDNLSKLNQNIQFISEKQESADNSKQGSPISPLAIEILHAPQLDPARREYYEAENSERKLMWRKLKPWVEASGVSIAIVVGIFNLLTLLEIRKQTPSFIVSAHAAESAAKTAIDTLQVGNRPWVKVTHQIIKPLDFNFVGASGPAATMTVEDRLENVGSTVALNVFSWEDVIPMDADGSTRTAVARQNEWCGFNRNSEQTRSIGSILFPHDPSVQHSGMGTLMTKVNQALAVSPIKGKVGFVMVGCVVYRSSFEPRNKPNHQTRFIYDLGIPQSWGGWMPYILPQGVATDIRLIQDFRGYTAD